MIIWWRRVLIAVSACAAVLASFVFLRDLAVHAGWPVWTSPLLPLSIDALAAAALTEYRRTRSRTAAAVSVGAIAASVAGNAVSHLISTGLLIPGWVVVTAVGSVPAVTVGLVVHIFTARDTPWSTSQSSDTSTHRGVSIERSSADLLATAVPPPPPPIPASPAAPAAASVSKPPSPHVLALLETVYERGLQDMSSTRLVSALSVSKGTAIQLRKLVLNGHYQQHCNGSPSAQQESAA